MILGMNPKEMRKRRSWCVNLWARGKHWALAIRPEGEAFQVRVVDDFIHEASHAYSSEVASTQFYLVYELLQEWGRPYLMLSAKTDFDADSKALRSLGSVASFSMEDIQVHAIASFKKYHGFNLFGSNTQHFAVGFASSLGAPDVENVVLDDETFTNCASDLAVAVGASGAVVAVTSTAGAAGAATVTTMTQPTTTCVFSIMLKGMAAGATGMGMVGGLSLLGIVAGYKILGPALQALQDQPETYYVSGRHCHATREPQACTVTFNRKSEMLLLQGCRGAMIGCWPKRCLPAPMEPDVDAAAARDQELDEQTEIVLHFEVDTRGMAAPEPERDWRQLAPWCSATSWEQPPWVQKAQRQRALSV